MDITVTVGRTGQVLDVGQSQILMDQGIYTVFDDGIRHIIPSKVNTVGERLEVTGDLRAPNKVLLIRVQELR